MPDNSTPAGRRAPAESRKEILDAAAAALWDTSLAELTVGGLMARTRLGRSSFYVHFDDIDDLVTALLDDLEQRLWEPARRWTEATSDHADRDLLHEAVAGVVDVWVEHGPVLAAIVEASLSNAQLHDRWRRQLVGRFIDGVTDGIRRLRGDDAAAAPARELATALLLMNERYLTDRLGRTPQHDAAEVTATLTTIWTAVLYR